MEAKDLAMVVGIPIIVITLVASINGGITGLVVTDEESNRLGTYSIMPSFRARIDYNINEYVEIKTKLKNAISECTAQNDFAGCMVSKRKELGWECGTNSMPVLADFLDKLKECALLEDETAVCRFSFGKNEIVNSNNRDVRAFEIKLTNWYQRVKAELIENGNVIETEYIDVERLYYTDYNNREKEGILADELAIKLAYINGMPGVHEAYALKGKERIGISKAFLVYKKGKDLKFIDVSVEASFKAVPANKIIDLPRLKGMKFCAKSAKKAIVSDGGKITPKDITYEFAVKFSGATPGPIESIGVKDAINAENSAILLWKKSAEVTTSAYHIYYSKKDFSGMKTNDMKKDSEITKISVPLNDVLEIEEINLEKCTFEQIGMACNYGDFGRISKGTMYSVSKQNKMFYLVDSLEDGQNFHFAVTAVDSEGNEIDNDKSVKNNGHVLSVLKNYGIFAPVDDLAPGIVQQAAVTSLGNGRARITWNKPMSNLDGTESTDIVAFNIYYKSYIMTPNPIPPRLDSSFTKLPIPIANANCAQTCSFEMQLEPGAYYFAVTAIDERQNEYPDAEIKIFSVQ